MVQFEGKDVRCGVVLIVEEHNTEKWRIDIFMKMHVGDIRLIF